jgi:glyoxylase-like metal-dependent hydrolase (beta-lactamase superfamily II)
MAAPGNGLPLLRSIRLEMLAEGVYAAIAVPGEGALGNAGIVDLGERSLVFDTLRTPQAAQELRLAAERLTGKPVTWVVNSHWHDDHCAGNQVFAPQAAIVATTRTRALMATRLIAEYVQDEKDLPALLQSLEEQLRVDSDEPKREQLALRLAENRRYAAAIPTIRISLPDLTFTGRLVFHGSRRSAELITYGGGHTASDAFLYLPAEQLALMGDLVFLQYHPWLPDGDPQEWVRILDEVARLPLTTILPGHGPVGDIGGLALTRDYVTTLQRLAEDALSAGASVEQAGELSVPTPYETWGYPQFFAANMRFLCGRLKLTGDGWREGT